MLLADQVTSGGKEEKKINPISCKCISSGPRITGNAVSPNGRSRFHFLVITFPTLVRQRYFKGLDWGVLPVRVSRSE